MSFHYVEDERQLKECDAFVMLIPKGIESKRDLLVALATAGQFPDHFGENWDALLDLLRDFSWISSPFIIIRHSDIPLSNDALECSRYLGVMIDAQKDWEDTRKSCDMRAAGWTGVDHQLKIVFPKAAKPIIDKILRQ